MEPISQTNFQLILLNLHKTYGKNSFAFWTINKFSVTFLFSFLAIDMNDIFNQDAAHKVWSPYFDYQFRVCPAGLRTDFDKCSILKMTEKKGVSMRILSWLQAKGDQRLPASLIIFRTKA